MFWYRHKCFKRYKYSGITSRHRYKCSGTDANILNKGKYFGSVANILFCAQNSRKVSSKDTNTLRDKILLWCKH